MKNLLKLLTNRDGKDWYREANKFCNEIAEQYQLELPIVVAILSAMSPGTNWEQNKKDAVNLIRANGNAHTKQFRFTTYGKNVIKAQNIYSGKLRPDEAFNPRTGAKTYNFYHNILNPDAEHFVTIDRHAFTIATGEPYVQPHLAKYERVADHYRRFAKLVGLLPSELQAILWVSYRKENGIQQAGLPF